MPYPLGVTYQQIREALRSTRLFYPNATTIAEFRPNSVTLHFHYLSRETFAVISERGVSGGDLTQIGVVAHELTHWSDQVSSVWGQTYLIKLFDAYSASRSGREERFHRAIELFDEERRILLPLYYHVLEKGSRPHNKNNPWRIEFSAGQEFGADGQINAMHPLFFVSFGDHETGVRVARQPITVGALLETTATWSELRAHFSGLKTLPSDEYVVESKLWSTERLKALYDPELTVYTAPVHMLANFVGTSDVLEAYERGALLANVALNLTDALFNDLLHPDDFELFGNRLVKFSQARNRGYAFALLAKHAASLDFNLPIKLWLEDVLKRAGLPSYENIMHAAYVHLEAIGRTLPVRSALDNVRDYLLGVGRDRFLDRVSNSFSGWSYDAFGAYDGVMPPMFDCNGELFHRGVKPLDPFRFDPETMHHAEWKLREFTDNLLLGCRGL